MAEGDRREPGAVPAGMVVRKANDVTFDGPLPRRDIVRSSTIVEVKRPGRPVVRSPLAIVGAALVVVLAFFGGYRLSLIVAITLVVLLIASPSSMPVRVLTIADKHLQLVGGRRLMLAIIRKLEVVARRDQERNRDVVCVVAHTDDDQVEVARLDQRAHAEYVEQLVDQAHRALLRDPE